jgi:hypothetical protein
MQWETIPKTKTIVPVHLFGHAANRKHVICQRHNYIISKIMHKPLELIVNFLMEPKKAVVM